MENQFASFTPIELKSSPSKEDIARYYKDNNIMLDNDYLNNYFGLNKMPDNSAIFSNVPNPVPSPTTSTNPPTYTKTPSYMKSSTSTNEGNTSISHNAKKVIDFFVGKGLTREQSAGIAGNLYSESRFKLDALGDNGSAFGVAQWRDSRLDNLKSFATSTKKPLHSLETQLEFLWKELQTTENTAFQALKDTDTIEDAARVFANKFERMKTYNIEREQKAHEFSQL
jgi:hypothetical protein